MRAAKSHAQDLGHVVYAVLYMPPVRRWAVTGRIPGRPGTTVRDVIEARYLEDAITRFEGRRASHVAFDWEVVS